jgi:uncharacterized protein
VTSDAEKIDLQLVRSLADQGSGHAQGVLGCAYFFGEGIPQDYAEAAKWLHKAADQGNAYAQSMLGDAYFFGEGVPQDYVLAHMWCNLAAAQGREESPKNRDLVAEKMTTRRSG